MADIALHQCTRPWWMRPPVWFIGMAVAAVLAFVVFEGIGGPVVTPYGTFLDQLDAGNIASVTFRGHEISGRLKRPLNATVPAAAVKTDTFRSHVPDFGDSVLIFELRKQHVTIDVAASSQWTSWLGRMPWPMLAVLGVILIAGLVRLVRGERLRPASGMPMNPMQGIFGLVSGLFESRPPPKGPSGSEGNAL